MDADAVDAAFKEGRGKQLRYLQDIPQDQRTQRHAMQIEYYTLAEKCVAKIEMASRAVSQGVPLHVTAAMLLGNPVALHALLARMFFLSQVGLPCMPRPGDCHGSTFLVCFFFLGWESI